MRVIRDQFRGPGGIGIMLRIALPIIVSNAAETCMMFVDRMFLARLGREHLSAALSGGLTAFMMLTFFLGLIGYVNALVAQYYGAGRKDRCAVAAAQGLLVGAASYPVVLLAAPLGRFMLYYAGHEPLQYELEVSYYAILIWGSLMPLLRSGLSAFFCGIGRTRIVMLSNLIAMVINIGANYILIFGKFGCPALGIRGAAFGTLLGSATGLVIMVAGYFWPAVRREFGTLRSLVYERGDLRRLLRFGLPSGVEFFLNLAAFNTFVQIFHSYGADAAAAITITFNWDFVAFLPLFGFNMAVMSLVGRYMGAGQPDLAARSAYSGLKAASFYGGLMSLMFLLIPGPLVSVFAGGEDAAQYAGVIPLAVATLRLAGIYTLADAAVIVFDGALRGAGDTRWTMVTSVSLHWIIAGASLVLIKLLHAPPLLSWLVFSLLMLLLAAALALRFAGGRWRTLKVIEPVAPPAATLPAADTPPDTV